MRLVVSLLALVLLEAPLAAAGIDPLLADTAKQGGFSDAEISAAADAPQARAYEAESKGRQVTVLSLSVVPASPAEITAKLRSRHGLLKSDALRTLGVFSNPPKMSDLAKYQMPESDLESLADCELANCKFKLGQAGVELLQTIDWSKADAHDRVNTAMKDGMLQFVAKYEQQGNAALLVSVDKEERQSFAEGAEKLTGQLGLSRRLIPTLRMHLLEYPRQGIPGATDRILWTLRDYGYRPVTSVVHSIIYEPETGPPATLIALKTLYSNHYFHARQRLIGLWADTEDPNVTWVGYSDRLLFDGDVGSIKRRMLQDGIVENALTRLGVLKGEF